MNTLNYMGMLLLSYFALFSAHRAGLAQLKYRQIHRSGHEAASYPKYTNIWVSMMAWIIVAFLSLVLVIKIAP